MNDSQLSENKRPAPPYVSFPSFKTTITGFKENGVPSRIDRSVLGKFSGIVGSQLLTALRFLRLIDDKNHPLDRLRDLVGACGSDAWDDALQAVLKQAYSPLFELDLQAVSPSQFNERFSKSYPGKGSTARKSITFFLTAAKDAKVSISPYLTKNKKPRSWPSKKRSTRANGPMKEERIPSATPPPRKESNKGADEDSSLGAASDPWLAKFPDFNPEWEEKIQQKWFEAFEKLMSLRKPQAAKAEKSSDQR